MILREVIVFQREEIWVFKNLQRWLGILGDETHVKNLNRLAGSGGPWSLKQLHESLLSLRELRDRNEDRLYDANIISQQPPSALVASPEQMGKVLKESVEDAYKDIKSAWAVLKTAVLNLREPVGLDDDTKNELDEIVDELGIRLRRG